MNGCILKVYNQKQANESIIKGKNNLRVIHILQIILHNIVHDTFL